MCVSIHLSFHPSFHPSFLPFIHPPSTHPFILPPFHLPIHHFILPSFHSFVTSSLPPSFPPSFHPYFQCLGEPFDPVMTNEAEEVCFWGIFSPPYVRQGHSREASFFLGRYRERIRCSELPQPCCNHEARHVRTKHSESHTEGAR